MKSEEKKLTIKVNKEKPVKKENKEKDFPKQDTLRNLNEDKKLPFDISKDLKEYQRILVAKEFDLFRVAHCFENALGDYKIYGESPNGDITLLFTSSLHFECTICNCCDNIVIPFYCFTYSCCDSIIFQMDYRRNGKPFYTQGYNLLRGFHCCKCYCCSCFPCCSRVDKLFLRETTNPNNRGVSEGKGNGRTEVDLSCCVWDYISTYRNEKKQKGYGVRGKCFEVCGHSCLRCCCGLDCDFKLHIEDAKGKETGNIMIYSGCFSEKVKGRCCYLPRKYFEVNIPPEASSEQKFQIIADLIHFDIVHGVL